MSQVIYSIKGENRRMGHLFRTPKHFLLYEGVPAIEVSIKLMSMFGQCTVVTNEYNTAEIPGAKMVRMGPTESIVDMLRQMTLKDHIFVVDCDIVPLHVTPPKGNTVYCFANETGQNLYSNYKIDTDFNITEANEKGKLLDVCGAGIYYFDLNDDFYNNSVGCKSLSEVFQRMISNGKRVHANVTSEIYRLGTLPDITGGFTDNKVDPTYTKVSKLAENELKWYNSYEDKRDIPKIISFAPGSLTMEFLISEGKLNVFSVIDLVEKYRKYKPLNELGFSAYIDRIESHLVGNPISNGKKLLNRLNGMVLSPTFAHGDLSCINIITTRTGPRLIDPLYCDNFGNYVIDYAKLLFSLKFFRNDIENYELLYDQLDEEGLDVLIASEAVRVATYNKKFTFIAENLINEL